MRSPALRGTLSTERPFKTAAHVRRSAASRRCRNTKHVYHRRIAFRQRFASTPGPILRHGCTSGAAHPRVERTPGSTEHQVELRHAALEIAVTEGPALGPGKRRQRHRGPGDDVLVHRGIGRPATAATGFGPVERTASASDATPFSRNNRRFDRRVISTAIPMPSSPSTRRGSRSSPPRPARRRAWSRRRAASRPGGRSPRRHASRAAGGRREPGLFELPQVGPAENQSCALGCKAHAE
jgi:hypothetical protein